MTAARRDRGRRGGEQCAAEGARGTSPARPRCRSGGRAAARRPARPPRDGGARGGLLRLGTLGLAVHRGPRRRWPGRPGPAGRNLPAGRWLRAGRPGRGGRCRRRRGCGHAFPRRAAARRVTRSAGFGRRTPDVRSGLGHRPGRGLGAPRLLRPARRDRAGGSVGGRGRVPGRYAVPGWGRCALVTLRAPRSGRRGRRGGIARSSLWRRAHWPRRSGLRRRRRRLRRRDAMTASGDAPAVIVHRVHPLRSIGRTTTLRTRSRR